MGYCLSPPDVFGGLVEYRQSADTTRLRWRAGGFGGVEPDIMKLGYASGVSKFGGYFALDGNGAQRSVVGYINVRNQSLTERSVLSFTNYLPVKQSVFIYRAAEVDLTGPGGQGSGGLTYFFASSSPQFPGLWRTDGTSAGTEPVKAGIQGETMLVSGGVLYFAASDDSGGLELWKSNGTPEGTVRVKDNKANLECGSGYCSYHLAFECLWSHRKHLSNSYWKVKGLKITPFNFLPR